MDPLPAPLIPADEELEAALFELDVLLHAPTSKAIAANPTTNFGRRPVSRREVISEGPFNFAEVDGGGCVVGPFARRRAWECLLSEGLHVTL
jgi:hypothetical protein